MLYADDSLWWYRASVLQIFGSSSLTIFPIDEVLTHCLVSKEDAEERTLLVGIGGSNLPITTEGHHHLGGMIGLKAFEQV